MKLFTVEMGQQRRVGALLDGHLADLTAAYAAHLAAQGPKQGALRVIPTDMLSFIRLGTLALEAARETIAYLKKRPAVPVGEQLSYPLEAVKLLAPVPRPGKILCAEGNFREANTGSAPGAPSGLILEARFPSTVIPHQDPIIIPRAAREVACGVELAAVIGKRMKSVPASDALSFVFGYTILNGVRVQDAEAGGAGAILRANFDSFCPLGPCIVTADEIADPGDLHLRLLVNGAAVQDGRTSGWAVPLARMLATLSQVMTLEPGDIVSTGTPGGRTRLLKEGDVVQASIESIGLLENKVAAEPEPAISSAA